MKKQVPKQLSVEEYELCNKLKTMRFSGMAAELEKVFSDPNENLIPFNDKIQRIIDAEWNLRYTKKSIEAALRCLDEEKTKEQKVALLIVKLIPSGESITVEQALDKISLAYNEVGITKIPKSKDLHRWFDCSDPVSRRIDGKVKKVVDIYRSKIVFRTNND